MQRKLKIVAAAVLVSGAVAAVALAASSPAVVTGKADHTKDTSALLHGTVNPNGADTTYFFQWGLDTNYGVNGKPVSAGSGTKAVGVSEDAESLIPGTTYHFRLVASNRFGTSVGADRTFMTSGHPPPDVATGPATQLSTTGATLTGVVNPRGQQTTYTFQYGTTTSYGSQTFGGTVQPGDAAVSVASTLTGLAPETIFHYRLVATHGSEATAYGADGIFMTFPVRRPVPHISASTKPRRDRRRPYAFATSGRVGHPSRIPSAFACSGNVAIHFFNGRRLAGVTFVGVQPDCTFTAQTVFRHLPRHPRGSHQVTLRVSVRFLGNGYLAPHLAAKERITLG